MSKDQTRVGVPAVSPSASHSRIVMPSSSQIAHHRAIALVLYLRLAHDIIAELVASLFLLHNNLVDSIVLKNTSLNTKLEIQTGLNNRWSQNENAYTVHALDCEIEHLLFFLANYYKNGFANVNHIDIQCNFPINGDFTIEFEYFT